MAIEKLSWYNCKSNSTKKLLMMIILRARKPLKMTGGGLYTISLETFLKQMKAAISYIAVLNAVLV
jgi:hypothetical protein